MAPVHRKTARLVFIIVLAVLVLFFLVLHRGGTPEPVYNGKSLTEWLENFSPDAIRAIGTNGIPTLLNLLRRKDSGLQKRFIMLSEKPALFRFRKYSPFRLYSADFYRANAGSAFCMLGPVAKDAVPELSELLNDEDYSIRKHAMLAMSGIGTEMVVLPYTHALTNDSREVRSMAAAQLGWGAQTAKKKAAKAIASPSTESAEPWKCYLMNSKTIVSSLVAALKDPDPDVREGAIYSLGRIGLEPELALPALSAELQDKDAKMRKAAARALKGFGDDASWQ
ncbi:HEAT repeat domain-containing protein [Pedosphaera parvula]|uniref:HEAT domain containing protein n=1 Tax=Pedosphaera parvula (strain Ellin514) TaxID=320771 RepID=B9XMB8_PEDPL|nr:HEAT repeat domain-containing protein [Pedosphaera parvula]EEF58960.1 HEAT domain containing protein [Pedosphaera parvula Ellin514]